MSNVESEAHLNEKSSDFDEIWYTNADLELRDRMNKYENF